MRTILILCITFFLQSSYAQNWQWAVAGGDIFGDVISEVEIDHEGNIIASGSFSGFLTIDSLTLGSGGSTQKAFISKWDSCGQLLWIKESTSSSSSRATALEVDPFGNIFMAGKFSGTIGFDNLSISGSGGPSYLARFKPDGTISWIREYVDFTISSFTLDMLETDDGGNVTWGSYYYGKAYFNDTSIFSYGPRYDLLIIRYDSIGNVVWRVHEGGNKDEYLYDITIDNSGNVYAALAYESNQFIIAGDTLPNVPSSGSVGLILKYNRHGEFLWALPLRGSRIVRPALIKANENNEILISGFFVDDLTIGDTTITASVLFNPFLSKIDSTGQLIWLTVPDSVYNFTPGLNNAIDFRTMLIGPDNSFYLGGNIEDTLDWGGALLAGHDAAVPIIVQVDSAGGLNEVLIKSYLPDELYTNLNDLEMTQDGDWVMGGNFRRLTRFGNFSFPSAGSNPNDDFYISSFGECPSYQLEISATSQNICPDDSLALSAIDTQFPIGCLRGQWEWYLDSTLLPLEDQAVLYAKQAGDYYLRFTDSSCQNVFFSPTISLSQDTVMTPEILSLGLDSLTTTTQADAYIWLRDGIQLPFSGPVIPADSSGIYAVVAKLGDCLSDTSNTFPFIANSLESSFVDEWHLYPNPISRDERTIYLQNQSIRVNDAPVIRLNHISGKLVEYESIQKLGDKRWQLILDSSLSPGIYLLEISSQSKIQRLKVFLR
ncbi:MAG: T9SS type A sorting domain-containing protein [Bacteroidota bacterium]